MPKRLKLWKECLILFCIFSLACGFVPVRASAAAVLQQDYTLDAGYTAPEIRSPCAFLFEMNTGTVLYAKNADEPHAPASTIKTLTTLVAVENGNLDDVVTFSEASIYDIEDGGSNEDMRVGETMSLRSCLEIMMLASCNEAAYVIAEYLGGSLSGFAEMMNARAQQAGAINSNFTNPHGLTDWEQYTTARDLALIFADCVQNPEFMKIATMESCCVTDTTENTYGYVYANHDKMMLEDSVYWRDYVVCGKTGFITIAGNTLVTYAQQDGMEIVCVILYGDSYDDVYRDTIDLCDYAFDAYRMVEPDELGDALVEAELGPCDVLYENTGILLPEWMELSEIQVEMHGLSKGDYRYFTGALSMGLEERTVTAQFTAEPIVNLNRWVEPRSAPEAPQPVVDTEPADEEIPELPEDMSDPDSADLTWLWVHLAAGAVILSILLSLLIWNLKLRKRWKETSRN